MEYTLRNNQVVKIRETEVKDAALILDFFVEVNKETKYLSREPHEVTMTLDDEMMYLDTIAKSEHDCMLVVFNENSVIGTIGFHGSGLSRLKHKVTIGLSILSEYQNLGLGSYMMDLVLEKARLYGKTKVELEVRIDNFNAIRLYEKVGFRNEGIRRNGFLVDGEYIDLLLMGIVLD
jgi:RimJ/RimL family protein N-acetyltransferase